MPVREKRDGSAERLVADIRVCQQGLRKQAGDVHAFKCAILPFKEPLNLAFVLHGIERACAVYQHAVRLEQGGRMVENCRLNRQQANNFLMCHVAADLRLAGEQAKAAAGDVRENLVKGASR